MLIEIEDKIVSTEIFTRKFVCDLNACKGACCVEGDSGAPLNLKEVELITENINEISNYMTEKGIEVISKKGVSYLDEDNEHVTSLIDGKDCAFVFRDDNGIVKCAIEKAYNEKKINFNKPISCHLYPIRVKKFGEYTALNYDSWKICSSACSCGEKLNVSVFRFLREPLIRAFGEEFYKELELVESEL
jgi:hypothetical protein